MKTMTIAILLTLITSSALFSQETKTDGKKAEPKATEAKAVDLKTAVGITDVSIYNSGTFRDYVAVKSFKTKNAADIPLAVEVKVTYRMGADELGSRILKIGVLPKGSESVFSVGSENSELVLQPEWTEIRTDGDVVKHTRAVVTVHSAVPSDCKDRAAHFTADMLAVELASEERKVNDAWDYYVVRANRAANAGFKVGPKDWDGTPDDLVRFDDESGAGRNLHAASYHAANFGRDYIVLAKQYLDRANLLVTLHGDKADLGASKTLKIKESKLTDENVKVLRQSIGLHNTRISAVEKIGVRVDAPKEVKE